MYYKQENGDIKGNEAGLRPLGGTDELDRANAHLWNKM
jgi:hypothetical protein